MLLDEVLCSMNPVGAIKSKVIYFTLSQICRDIFGIFTQPYLLLLFLFIFIFCDQIFIDYIKHTFRHTLREKNLHRTDDRLTYKHNPRSHRTKIIL